jgi:phospholipase C
LSVAKDAGSARDAAIASAPDALLLAPDAGDASAEPDATTAAMDAASSDASASDAGATDGSVGRIDHLVIVVFENHTLDNLFANFPGANTSTVITLMNGTRFPAPTCPDPFPRDLQHGHDWGLVEWNQGAMNGWELAPDANTNDDHLAWCQYTQSQLHGLWDLALNYNLADNFFSGAIAPSMPGHTFYLAAQSAYELDDPEIGTFDAIPIWGCDDPIGTTVPALLNGTCAPANPYPCFDMPSAPDVLLPGLTWKFYGTGVTYNGVEIVWSMFDSIRSIRRGPGWNNVITYLPAYDNDARNGLLPNVTWLVNQDLFSGHPPLSMCAFDSWLTRKVNEVIMGPQWSTTAILVAWDDFGGFYDHVPPPVQYGCDAQHPYGLGFRLPLVIISPWVKHGVFHGFTEQASVVRLIEELFGGPGAVGALHRRDAAARDDVAGSLLDAFDFNQTPLPPITAHTNCP